MATHILTRLLEERAIEGAIVVQPTEEPTNLFRFAMADTPDAIRDAAGSAYHPISISEIVHKLSLRTETRRFALVGLPCAIKALRLAMLRLPHLKDRLPFLLGLTCGHLPNHFYTEFLGRRSGILPDEMHTVRYRSKSGTRRAGDYSFVATSKAGTLGATVPFSSLTSIWHDGFFGVNACNYCDDIFAEVADVTLMDAWLRPYVSDPRGHSLLVIRNPSIQALLLKDARSGECFLEPISIDAVADSQRGVIRNKRQGLAARLHRAASLNLVVPPKRVRSDSRRYLEHQRCIDAKFAVQAQSKRLWPACRGRSLLRFQSAFWILSLPLRLHRWHLRLRNLAARISRRIRGSPE